MEGSFVKRGKGKPDMRRLVLETMTRRLMPTAPQRTVAPELADSAALGRSLEALGFDELDVREIPREAEEFGCWGRHLEKMDTRKLMDLSLWEYLDQLCRPKPERRSPGRPKKEDPKDAEQSED